MMSQHNIGKKEYNTSTVTATISMTEILPEIIFRPETDRIGTDAAATRRD